jgi:hypothetical protein
MTMSATSDGHYKVYEEHMKTLRAWFVAYGVGGPVLFVTQQDFAATLVDSGLSQVVGVLFLVGVLLQALVALFNKWVNWGLYYFDEDDMEAVSVVDTVETSGDAVDTVTKPQGLQRFCESYSGKVWIDIIADLATLALFAIATVLVLIEVSKGAGAA